MPIGRDGWFEAAAPIRVEGGLRARSKRGSIGEQWWSRRFIDILEEICDPGRLSRGRAYARKGQVLEMGLAPGTVRALVQGSRPEPYQVTITVPAYDDADWTRVERELSRRALYRAKLLAGEMPPEIVEVFETLNLSLFPTTFDMTCSCPDWSDPCKHLSAVLYLLAESFDDDPFQILHWRGRPRPTLLTALHPTPPTPTPRSPTDLPDTARSTLTPTTPALNPTSTPNPTASDPSPTALPADPPFTERLTDFYTPTTPLSRLHPPPTTTNPPELLLRALDPPPLKIRHIPLMDILRPAYRSLPDQEEERERPKN